MPESYMGPGGNLSLKVVKSIDLPRFDEVGQEADIPARELTFEEMMRLGTPQKNIAPAVNQWRKENRPHLWRGLKTVLAARALKIPHFYGALAGRILRANGDVEELGLMSLRAVTKNGVDYIVAAFNAGPTVANFKYHGIGTDSTVEDSAQTGLIAELTVEYANAVGGPAPTAVDNTSSGNNQRGFGTLATGSGTSTTAVFQTVGLNNVDSAVTIREHGIFSQQQRTGTTPSTGGTLLDRSKFNDVGLSGGDSLQTTYNLTLTAGG